MISKKVLYTYLQQNNLTGTVDFLQSLKNGSGRAGFYAFCNQNGLILPESSESGVLFHGSREHLSALRPNKSVGKGGVSEEDDLVYATDNPNYAVFLAVIVLKNGSASVHADSNGTVLSVDLDFVNGPSHFADGFVHVVSDAEFKKTTNSEYVSSKNVDILFSVPVSLSDITAPIEIRNH